MNQLKQAKEFYHLISEWLGEGGKAVNPDHSQKRADVCLKCPKNNVNTSLESLFKDAVAATIKKQLDLKNKMNLRVNGEKSLGICDVCGCVNRLKVHSPIKFILENTDEETMKELPSECWQKIESKNL